MSKIRLAIAGIGNCASSLVQGLAYYHDKQSVGKVAAGKGMKLLRFVRWQLGEVTSENTQA